MCLNTLLSQYAAFVSCVVLVSQVASMCVNTVALMHISPHVPRISAERAALPEMVLGPLVSNCPPCFARRTCNHLARLPHLAARAASAVASLALGTMTF